MCCTIKASPTTGPTAVVILCMTLWGCASPPERMTGEQVSAYPVLTKDEFDKVVKVGTTVRHRTAASGTVRTWHNDRDGSFVASVTDGALNGGRPMPWVFGHGKWWTKRNEYCVSIQWRSKDENALRMEDWCRALYLVNGTYYLAPVTMTTRQREDIWGTADFSN